ncbi:hypothetical protein B0H13DRAFT_1907259 [Mycena leptocephala]|nr:hypothetical protein B0H13DRAFT_1907259 [Mycena leptocephala]
MQPTRVRLQLEQASQRPPKRNSPPQKEKKNKHPNKADERREGRLTLRSNCCYIKKKKKRSLVHREQRGVKTKITAFGFVLRQHADPSLAHTKCPLHRCLNTHAGDCTHACVPSTLIRLCSPFPPVHPRLRDGVARCIPVCVAGVGNAEWGGVDWEDRTGDAYHPALGGDVLLSSVPANSKPKGKKAETQPVRRTAPRVSNPKPKPKPSSLPRNGITPRKKRRKK